MSTSTERRSRRRALRGAAVVLAVAWLHGGLLRGAAWAKTPSVKEILDRVDDLYQGKSSRGVMTMKVVTEHWKRELRMEFWSKGAKQSLVRVLAPQKSKGTATLKSGNNIWNYLPNVRRTIKVPSSMMGGSWMGSHFTNDDLVKMSRTADDYSSKITFTGKRGDQELIEITALPRQDAAVVWGKLVLTLRATDLLPLQIVYYKEDMKVARKVTFSDIKRIGGRLLPAELRVVPADKPGEATVVSYERIEFDVALADGFFSLRSLER